MPFQPPSGSLGRNVLDVGARLAPTVFLGVILHLGGVCAGDVPSPLLLSIPGVKTLRVTIPSCYCSKNLPGWRGGVFIILGACQRSPLCREVQHLKEKCGRLSQTFLPLGGGAGERQGCSPVLWLLCNFPLLPKHKLVISEGVETREVTVETLSLLGSWRDQNKR